MKHKTRTLVSLYFSILSSNTVMAGETEGRPAEIRTPARPVSRSEAPLTPFTPGTIELLANAFCSPAAQATAALPAATDADNLSDLDDEDDLSWLTEGTSTSATSGGAGSSEEDDPFNRIFGNLGSPVAAPTLPSLDSEMMSPNREDLKKSKAKIDHRIAFRKVFDKTPVEPSPHGNPKKTGRSASDYDLRPTPTKKTKE